MGCTSVMSVKYVRAHQNAIVPTMGSKCAAGYDLFSVDAKVIPKKSRALFSTGIRMRIPEGCYGRISARSGLALKYGIDVGAGIIDRDYTGIVYVLLFNHGNEDYNVLRGDRIAQIIFERVENPTFELVDEDIEATDRSDGGFGSTGC